MDMFCYQCQETAKNTGCTIKGVCGKTSDVANLQDALMFILKGVCYFNEKLRAKGVNPEKADKIVFDGLFSTITNANFSDESFHERIKNTIAFRNKLHQKCIDENITLDDQLPEFCTWETSVPEEMEQKGIEEGVLRTENEDIRSLRELTIYGLKGMAAYAEHAWNLGHKNEEVYAFMQRALLATTEDLTADELVQLVLDTGAHGVKVMATLDEANSSSYGSPEMTEVNLGVSNRPGILVSGHDLKDMEELLKQTEGTGVDIYTHSEMLPTHYYPKLKKYKHLIGNYGGSWWRQKEDFSTFNGPILFTTNCIVPPSRNANYIGKIYTTGAAGLDGAPHIEDRKDGEMKDFSPIIEHALTCEPPIQIEEGKIIGGFAHAQVFALADKVVDAVKSGAIKKFFVMGGCDGRFKSRDYYTDFAQELPQDTIILTAGCAKYRYNKLPLGDIGGIPRVLDAGQCNDSYSLAVIALKLKEIFELNDINDLPIAYNIAWYEQKAVIVLLALLSLGVKNIHLGPTLPAFLSPNVTNVLVDKFGISPISEVEEDIEKLMAV